MRSENHGTDSKGPHTDRLVFFSPSFWRSAYISQLFSLRNRVLVATDWLKTKVLGR